jgi:predicted nucleotidyltransferase
LDTSEKTKKYNLKQLLAAVVDGQPGVDEVYLFGSRAYNTGSHRSDCDLLVRIDPAKSTKMSSLREFSMMNCPALDFFVCGSSRAVSCSNDSFVYAATFEALVSKLDAVLLWTRKLGFTDFLFSDTGSWVFETGLHVDFRMTVLPSGYLGDEVWTNKVKSVETLGLPVRPYIGDTLQKAVAQISDVSRKMVFLAKDLCQRGSAKSGWTVNLESEYDCQNLFFTVIKPWLPELSREEVAIVFDEQKKISDFSLFQGQLIIEMKFVDSQGKKAEVVKTLEGLQSFYKRNANVRCLLMIIFVKVGVDVDGPKWEAEFSFMTKLPSVITMVIPVP